MRAAPGTWSSGAKLGAPGSGTRPEERLDAIAIILARAGSKGVPGKNAALVGGRPCIDWTIDAALSARRVALTLVSTDGPAIKRIAGQRGVMVIDRPARLAGDRARVDDAARHAATVLETLLGSPLHARQPLAILYGNVPIRPAGLIDRAVELMERERADSVQSYAPVGKHHPWWTARVDPATGRVAPWEGRVLNHGVFRRQDLPPAHVPDGGVLLVTRAALFLQVRGAGAGGPHAFFGRERRGIINGEGAVVDIDSPVDLLVADALLGGAGLKAAAGRRKRRAG